MTEETEDLVIDRMGAWIVSFVKWASMSYRFVIDV